MPGVCGVLVSSSPARMMRIPSMLSYYPEFSMANALQYLTEQLESWRKAGTFQRLRELESPCEPVARFDGKEVINLASNNYLGLANHPKLVEAAIEATKRYG